MTLVSREAQHAADRFFWRAARLYLSESMEPLYIADMSSFILQRARMLESVRIVVLIKVYTPELRVENLIRSALAVISSLPMFTKLQLLSIKLSNMMWKDVKPLLEDLGITMSKIPDRLEAFHLVLPPDISETFDEYLDPIMAHQRQLSDLSIDTSLHIAHRTRWGNPDPLEFKLL